MTPEEKNLKAQQRRRLIQRRLNDLMQDNPDLYYLPTVDVARAIHDSLQHTGRLSIDDQLLVHQLTVHDIQIILSHRE